MLEQKGTNKKSHRAGAWRRIDHALVDHAPVDHALVARANFAIWPRKKTGKFRSPPRILQTFQSGLENHDFRQNKRAIIQTRITISTRPNRGAVLNYCYTEIYIQTRPC